MPELDLLEMRGSKSARNGLAYASFRDPAGRVVTIGGRVIRIVNSSGASDLEAVLSSKVARSFIEQNLLVRTDYLERDAVRDLLKTAEPLGVTEDFEGTTVLEHEAIPFQSFPYEWPPEMLQAAGNLTLDLAEALVDEGLGLKDATPYNILFRGADPVFVDLLSFERRNPADPIWLPLAQFQRTFLLPLLVNRHFGVQLDQLLTVRRDGLEPEEVYRFCSPLRRLLPPFLSLASIPTWLGRSQRAERRGIYRPRVMNNPEKARFILRSSLKRLRRILESLTPQAVKESRWSDYMTCNSYTEEHSRAKQKFVERAIQEFKPGAVLDVGCNTGHFSAIVARSGARVVAIDSDPVVVGGTWQKARGERLDILPLVINLTRPSPATGWRNRECLAFLDRARDRFDAVMMLAVVHHMLVNERIPLSEIIELAAELTSDILIIEFIGPEDSMFKRIARGRDHLFTGLNVDVFEHTCRSSFDVVRREHLEDSSRWLFILRKKASAQDGN